MRTDYLKDRKYCAAFIDFSPETLSVWDCKKRYNLKPMRIGGKVYYDLRHLFAALGIPGVIEQLLKRKSAAKYINHSPGSLAVWDCTKEYDLEPIRIGRAVRYRISVLDKFLEQRQRP